MSQTETQDTRVDKETKKTKRWAVGLLISILSVFILSYNFLSSSPDVTNPFDQHAVQKATALPIDRPESIDIPGYPQVIDIEAGHTHSYIDLHNPETNEVHLSFSLRLNDDDEDVILYESGLVRPGYTITQQELNDTLDAGVYDASIHIQAHLYDDETGDIIDLNGVRNVLTFDVK